MLNYMCGEEENMTQKESVYIFNFLSIAASEMRGNERK